MTVVGKGLDLVHAELSVYSGELLQLAGVLDVGNFFAEYELEHGLELVLVRG